MDAKHYKCFVQQILETICLIQKLKKSIFGHLRQKYSNTTIKKKLQKPHLARLVVSEKCLISSENMTLVNIFVIY